MTDSAAMPPQGPVLDVDLGAVCANYAMLGRESGAEVAAVVKCDAYHLGMTPVARALYERQKCRVFFVVYPEEGARLRAALNDAAPVIYCFLGPTDETAPLYLRENLTPCINSLDEANLWAAHGEGRAAAVHVDTGMNRVGAPMGDAAAIAAVKNLKIELALSHLACASEPSHPKNREQRAMFLDAARHFPGARLSLAASGGALMDRSYAFDMIRAGMALYGGSPFDDADDERIAHVATLKAPVVQIRDLQPGETVGYGATFTAARPSRIAAVAIGHGDGYPRAAGENGAGVIGGERVPIAGRVSMDFTTLNATDLKNPVKVGDIVELFGPTLRLHEAADRCGRVPYDLLTGLGGRVVRHYLY